MHTNIITRTARWLTTAALTTLLIGCGGGSSDTSSPTPVPAPTGNVGPLGATVTAADNNASLVVPSGAVTAPINVTLTPVTTGFTADPQLVGTVYKLDSPDTALAQQADFAITIPAAALEMLIAPAQAKAVAPGPTPDLSIAIVCEADNSGCWFVDPLARGCTPPQKRLVGNVLNTYPVLLGYDSNFSSPDSLYNPGHPYHGAASFCAKPAPPVPQIVSLGQFATNLVTTFDVSSRVAKTKLNTIKSGYFSALLDSIAPTVKLTATIVPITSNTATIQLSVAAADNRAVTKVTLERMTGFSLTPTLQVTTTPIAQFVAAPYEWQSGTLALTDVYGNAYVACAYDAANNKACDLVAPQIGAPTITGFAATPATLPYGGGAVTLSWAATDAASLTLDNNIGDVSGQITQTVNVATTTTFLLTATNSNGNTTASVTVTVQPPPPPVIVSFTATPSSLPVGGGNVTLNWATTNATTLLLNNVAVTGTSKVVNVTASTAFTLTATGPGGTTSLQVNVVVAATNDRFVDPVAGLDTNSCSQAAQCKTIAKAMTGAPSGATVYLADSAYSTTSQPDVTIPDGVTLRATHPNAAILNGMILTVTGSATLNGLVLATGPFASCTYFSATSSLGTPTLALTGVQIQCEGGNAIGGKVKAVMTPGVLVGGLYTAGLAGVSYSIIQLRDTAELLIQGGIIDGNNTAAGTNVGLLQIIGNSKLTLDGVTIRNRKAEAVTMGEASSLVLQNSTLIDNVGFPGSCSAAIHMSSTGSLTMDHSQISNLPSVGICVDMLPTAPTLQFTQSTITNATTAIRSGYGFVGTTATITADGLSLTNNVYGIYWVGVSTTSFDLRNMTITGNTDTGISLSGLPGTSFKLGNSTVSNNTHDGVSLTGIMTADLGTTALPGGNTFKTNGLSGLHSGVDAGQTVNAVGNTWDANTAASGGVAATDALGKYPASTLVTGPKTHGKNIKLDNASTLNL